MKKIPSICAALVLFIGIIARSAMADDKCGSVKDVETFMQFNMPGKAMDCLDNLIATNPGDAKLHFMKGKYCLEVGNYDCAKDRFSVGPVRQNYGSEIAELYKSEAEKKLSSDMNLAQELLDQAAMYQPSLAGQMAEEFFQKGVQTDAKQYFDLAVHFNPSVGKRVADLYAEKSKTAGDDEQKVAYLGEAVKYDNSKYGGEYVASKEKLGRFYLEQAKKLARIPSKEQLTDKYKALARKNLGEAVVEQELPEARVYQPGTYYFSLKAGEQCDHWITFPSGVISNWNLDSPDGKFQAIYDDGEVVNLWSATSLPRNKYKFKLKAVTDQPTITMVVRQR